MVLFGEGYPLVVGYLVVGYSVGRGGTRPWTVSGATQIPTT